MEKQLNSKEKKPIIIKIFCIIGFVLLPISLLSYIVPSVRDQLIREFGPILITIQIISATLGLIGLTGYWKMKKWGVYTYTTMTIFSITSAIIFKVPFNIGYISAPLTVIIGFYYYKKMS